MRSSWVEVTSLQRGRVHAAFFVAVGLLYGTLISMVPNSTTAGTLWVGKLSAPFVALPILAGSVAHRRLSAASVGSVATVAAVLGIYLPFLIGVQMLANRRRQHQPELSINVVVSWARWVAFGTPWIALAVPGGGLVALGAHVVRQRHRALLAPSILTVFAFEPLAHLAVREFGVESLALAVTELSVGIAIATLTWWVSRTFPVRQCADTTNGEPTL